MTDINVFPHIDTLSDNVLFLAYNPESGLTGNFTVGKLKAYMGAVTPSPEPKGIDRFFVSNGDNSGVFFFAGTSWGTGDWGNPHSKGTVQFSASAILPGYGSLLSFADRADSDFATPNDANSWVTVDLISKRLKLTHYSIKSRSGAVSDLPRNWKMQGSNDGSSWTDLDIQVGNQSLTTSNQWITIPVSTTEFFRYFRHQQTGSTNTNAYYLTFGEWELYGTLIDV